MTGKLYLYIAIITGILLVAPSSSRAQTKDFDIKQVHFTQMMEYETDSVQAVAVQEKIKRGTDPELYSIYYRLFNSDTPATQTDYEKLCNLLDSKDSQYKGYLHLQRIQIWLYMQLNPLTKDTIGYYCNQAKQVAMEYDTPPDTFIHTWSLLILHYINCQASNEAFLEAQLMLQAAKEINYEDGLILGNIITGRILSNQKFWKLSAQYYETALELIEQAFQRKTNKSMTTEEDYNFYGYSEFVLTYLLSNLHSGNVQLVKEKLPLIDNINKGNDESLNNNLLYLKGLLYLKTNEEQELLKIANEFRQNMEAKDCLNNPQKSGVSPKDIYHYYEIMAEYCLLRHNYAEAQEYCLKMEQFHPATELKARILFGAKKYTEAAVLYKELYNNADSLRVVTGNNSVGRFAAFMENETLQLKYTYAQMEAQKADLQRNKVITYALFFIILLGFAFFYRNQKLMKRLRISAAELEKNNHILTIKEAETEQALIHAKEANRTKTSFLKNVTHEIRTPLNIILGYVQLLHASDEEEKLMLKEIQNHSNDLTRLVDTIIELSDYDTASQELDMQETDMQTCCMIAAEQIRLYLQPNVSLNIKPEEESFTFRTNEQAFIRVLNCLLYNAAKFTSQGEIELSYEKTEEQIRIYVQDTGKGIPAEQAEWIFEKFTKIDEFVPGFGLGLPLARTIALRLNGEIKLDTEYKEGARFVISLDSKK